MKKSVLTPGFEKKHSVPPYSEGKKAMARKRRVGNSKCCVVFSFIFIKKPFRKPLMVKVF